MDERVNHWCKICGTGYYACDDCDKLGNWRATACSPRHAQIYSALVFYNRKLATKEQTSSYLKSLDITTKEIYTFSEGVKTQLLDILDKPEQEVYTRRRQSKKSEG